MQYLSKCSGLGKIEHNAKSLTVVGNADQIIRIYGHTGGIVLVVDSDNKKGKLLNKPYKLIASSEVGVTGVINNQVVNDRKLKLQHYCYGIACHQEDLFLTSVTVLYMYSLDGKILYITNSKQNKLLTLGRDGTVLSIFMDPALNWLKGQVLECGEASKTVLQKLVTLATQRDGLEEPWSVCYDSYTDSIIVGQFNNNNTILVYKVK
ncbi:hypothetical protein DPMN_076861 [Dreissena polymorpha]|uniref:Uncharacterized protein n=1 Tax=Dreissena polymorpha TaxID=45954 RepID=A0A9D4BG47_DREPO|nr:hypothetical protein DPMN_076861 [Dreissena polymorpha]